MGNINGWMDGWIDAWMDGWMDHFLIVFKVFDDEVIPGIRKKQKSQSNQLNQN
jgi:hypothetical protein